MSSHHFLGTVHYHLDICTNREQNLRHKQPIISKELTDVNLSDTSLNTSNIKTNPPAMIANCADPQETLLQCCYTSLHKQTTANCVPEGNFLPKKEVQRPKRTWKGCDWKSGQGKSYKLRNVLVSNPDTCTRLWKIQLQYHNFVFTSLEVKLLLAATFWKQFS